MRKAVQKLSKFEFCGQDKRVSFVETLHVKAGVECDVYTFDGDSSQDLAVVHIAKGCKTPLQKVLQGENDG
jgi:hypothetical protein